VGRFGQLVQAALLLAFLGFLLPRIIEALALWLSAVPG